MCVEKKGRVILLAVRKEESLLPIICCPHCGERYMTCRHWIKLNALNFLGEFRDKTIRIAVFK